MSDKVKFIVLSQKYNKKLVLHPNNLLSTLITVLNFYLEETENVFSWFSFMWQTQSQQLILSRVMSLHKLMKVQHRNREIYIFSYFSFSVFSNLCLLCGGWGSAVILEIGVETVFHNFHSQFNNINFGCKT